VRKSKIKLFLSAFFRRACYFISIPVSLILILISPFYRVRLIGLQASRIGHYALNTELILCEINEETGITKNKTLFYNMASPCNEQLSIMWKRIIPVFPISRLAIQIDMILSSLSKKYKNDKLKTKYEPCSGAIDQNGLLLKYKNPHLNFTEKEKEKAKSILEKIGVKQGQRYICLIVRDSAYLNQIYPEKNWSYHDHRNADIAKYEKAALYLAEKGYVVFRMGKRVNQPFLASHPNIIDYANSQWRSDFMDIYLCAACYFCISTCTGLDCVSQIFRRPVLLTNISPVFGETLMWYPCTMYIPKPLKNIKTEKLVELSEAAVICKNLSREILKELATLNLIIIENTEDEILAAVIEMESRVKNEWQETEDEQNLQAQYWRHYKKHRPVMVNEIYLKLGSEFLKKNSSILLQ